MKRLTGVLLAGFIAGIVALSGCGSIEDPWKDRDAPVRAVSSFPPATSFLKKIGGDRVSVITLCTTTGPHNYQFNIRDTVLLRKANLFVGVGLGLDDHYLDRLTSNSGNPNLRTSKLGEAIAKEHLRANAGHDHDKHAEGDDCDCCGHGPNDPHVWLGIPQAIIMVRQLQKELSTVDPSGASLYEENASRFIHELKALQADGKRRLKDQKAPLITFHNSMGYFADNFGLKVLGSIQINPGSTPDSKSLAKLIESCKAEGRVRIAREPQYPPSSADTLEAELKNRRKDLIVDRLTFDPLESCASADELDAGWYLRKMNENIDALAGKHD